MSAPEAVRDSVTLRWRCANCGHENTIEVRRTATLTALTEQTTRRHDELYKSCPGAQIAVILPAKK